MELDIIKENVIMVYLKQIDNLLKEAQLIVTQASYYVHHTENPILLSEGEESSELVLNMATLGLQGSDAALFKKGLITFLMRRHMLKLPVIQLWGIIYLLGHLREYMSDCPMQITSL